MAGGENKRAGGGMWRVIACGVVISLAAISARAESLTIATYNIENYVAANRLVDGVYREAYPKPEAAKAALRGVIRALNADIVGLQEVGPRPYLDELQRDLKSEGVDYPYAAWLEAADTERHVGVISKRPFLAVKEHADLRFSYFKTEERVKRGLLEVRVATAGEDLTLFVVHLKSRFTDQAADPESAVRRAGEAVAVRDRVLERFPNPSIARFLIVGDCNDAPVSRPLRALVTRGKTPIAEMLPAADTRGDTWTHFYRKQDSYSRVDYVLVSAALKPAVIDGVARIFDGPEAKAASDHRPVTVRLEMTPAPASERIAH
jgi:endonuclease/exonuclease/phosphatase family metal-dependent hydrolase